MTGIAKPGNNIVNSKQHLHAAKGQSLVELAIGLTLLILLLSGIFDVGRAIFTQFALQDAAEEGIIYGIAFPQKCDNIALRVRNSLENNTTIPANPDVEILIDGIVCDQNDDPDIEMDYGDEIEVHVSSTFTMTMPFFTGTSLNLTGTANGTILRPPPPGT